MLRRPLSSTLFPYTTLFRSRERLRRPEDRWRHKEKPRIRQPPERAIDIVQEALSDAARETVARQDPDRKSTRLNSSHQIISYAVFCLKKKNQVAPTCHEYEH